MTTSDRSTAGRAPLEEERLVSDHSRRCLLTDNAGRDEIDLAADPLNESRRVTVEQHAAFREAITTKPPADPIDELVAELRELKPEGIE